MTLLQEANTIVSVICGTNKVAWAHVDRALTVLDWQHQECSSFMSGTYMASAYLEDVSLIAFMFHFKHMSVFVCI